MHAATKACTHLTKTLVQLTLECDGRVIDLPEGIQVGAHSDHDPNRDASTQPKLALHTVLSSDVLTPTYAQGVVCLNIQSYGGGANLWGANEGMELKQDGHAPPSMQAYPAPSTHTHTHHAS